MESNLNKINNGRSEQWANTEDMSSNSDGEPSTKRQWRVQPPWWSEEICQFKVDTIASRRRLLRARRRANVDEVVIDLAYAAYKHDKLVFQVAVADAKARAGISANKRNFTECEENSTENKKQSDENKSSSENKESSTDNKESSIGNTESSENKKKSTDNKESSIENKECFENKANSIGN